MDLIELLFYFRDLDFIGSANNSTLLIKFYFALTVVMSAICASRVYSNKHIHKLYKSRSFIMIFIIQYLLITLFINLLGNLGFWIGGIIISIVSAAIAVEGLKSDTASVKKTLYKKMDKSEQLVQDVNNLITECNDNLSRLRTEKKSIEKSKLDALTEYSKLGKKIAGFEHDLRIKKSSKDYLEVCREDARLLLLAKKELEGVEELIKVAIDTMKKYDIAIGKIQIKVIEYRNKITSLQINKSISNISDKIIDTKDIELEIDKENLKYSYEDILNESDMTLQEDEDKINELLQSI